VATSRRVALARQVHTDLVRDALGARRRPIVRMLRMSRDHVRPTYFDIVEPTMPALPQPVPVRPPAPLLSGGAAPERSAEAVLDPL
jgi:hypothetical protein